MRAEPGESDAYAVELGRVPPADTLTPADRYQELFVAVQTSRVFADSKTFVDCAPRRDPDTILEAYRRDRCAPGFDLRAFVDEHFVEERPPRSRYVSDPDRSLAEHIDSLWDVLTRHPHTHPTRSSLLPVPKPYVVPGGRFAELYYWDSYFTMLGLAHSGRIHVLRDMVENFAYLIGTFGHVPNGNRSYYLSRSQPPMFALMVRLLSAHDGSSGQRYLGRLRTEHAFWMDGAEALRPGDARRHCVRLEDGALLCRYWDDRDTPREESYLEDVRTAQQSSRAAHDVYRELRAGAASGWDFSTRWCDESGALSTIRTTTIVPVDLNCFLHALETLIAELSAGVGDETTAAHFQGLAALRQRAIERWLWDDASGAYMDLDLVRGRPRAILHAATVTPLFVGIASRARARRVSATLREHLLEEGGLATTKNLSGEQWDAPNGWAPLQWLAIRGLERYGETALSSTITRRWLETVASLYERESKLVEKYELRVTPEGAAGGGGGEYPLQDGFGWTNGVTGRLLHEDPVSPSHRARAGARRP